MFIEEKSSGLYVGKKSFGKTFLVKLHDEYIRENEIMLLTQKEIEYIQTTSGYQDFFKEIYNINTLSEILFYSKFLFNNVDVSTLEHAAWGKLGKDTPEKQPVYMQGKLIYGWFQNTFPKEFIYNSNHIEGSRIPKHELHKIIEEKKYSHKIKNEVQEVKNSIKAWNFLQHDFVFNIVNIKKLYHILTKDLLQENGERYPRGFKKVPNIAGINSMTTAPENVEYEMKMLIENYRKSRKEKFSLELAFDFHLKYEQIHPFENGNGRTGRLLMNKILMQNGMIPMIVFTENKLSYSNAIASCVHGKKKKYYKFMLEQYQKTLGLIDIYPGTYKDSHTYFIELGNIKKDRK